MCFRNDSMRAWRRLLAVALLTPLPHAQAATFSFTGTFTHDTDVALFEFTLAQPTAGVALRTFGYAGGTNGAGTLIPAGGVEPVLSLFMADGTGMNPGQSGPCGGVLPADPTTGACADVDYQTERSFPAGEWAAGTYTVALSSFANPAVGNLGDGFFAEVVLGIPSPGDFTCGPAYQGSAASDGSFCDEYVPGTHRTGRWALDIIGVDSAVQTQPAPVPLPASFASYALALALGALVRRRH